VKQVSGGIAVVYRTRTLVFSGGQGQGGHALGESDAQGNDAGMDVVGEYAAGFTLANDAGYQSSAVSATRASSFGAGRWTVNVVELRP
jgi:hypothetical protein